MSKKRGKHHYVLFFGYFLLVAFLAFYQYYGGFNTQSDVAGISTQKANIDTQPTIYKQKEVLASYGSTSLESSPPLTKTNKLNQLYTVVLISFVGFFIIIALFSYRFFRKKNIHNYR